MSEKIIAGVSSASSVVIAAISTQEDLRLWLASLLTVVISIIMLRKNKRKAEAEALEAEYESQLRRMELCKHCRDNNLHPLTCVVDPAYYPCDCPLRKKKP